MPSCGKAVLGVRSLRGCWRYSAVGSFGEDLAPGVPAGATTPFHRAADDVAIAVLPRWSGRREAAGCASLLAMTSARNCPALNVGQDERRRALNSTVDLTADDIEGRRRAAFVRHIEDIDACRKLQHLGHEVRDRAGRHQRRGELARSGFCRSHQFLERLDRALGIDDENNRALVGENDGRKILLRIVGQVRRRGCGRR